MCLVFEREKERGQRERKKKMKEKRHNVFQITFSYLLHQKIKKRNLLKILELDHLSFMLEFLFLRAFLSLGFNLFCSPGHLLTSILFFSTHSFRGTQHLFSAFTVVIIFFKRQSVLPKKYSNSLGVLSKYAFLCLLPL